MVLAHYSNKQKHQCGAMKEMQKHIRFIRCGMHFISRDTQNNLVLPGEDNKYFWCCLKTFILHLLQLVYIWCVCVNRNDLIEFTELILYYRMSANISWLQYSGLTVKSNLLLLL